jgi:hypothetical protein
MNGRPTLGEDSFASAVSFDRARGLTPEPGQFEVPYWSARCRASLRALWRLVRPGRNQGAAGLLRAGRSPGLKSVRRLTSRRRSRCPIARRLPNLPPPPAGFGDSTPIRFVLHGARMAGRMAPKGRTTAGRASCVARSASSAWAGTHPLPADFSACWGSPLPSASDMHTVHRPSRQRNKIRPTVSPCFPQGIPRQVHQRVSVSVKRPSWRSKTT